MSGIHNMDASLGIVLSERSQVKKKKSMQHVFPLYKILCYTAQAESISVVVWGAGSEGTFGVMCAFTVFK
jgi:hypothetical protein